MSVDPRWHRIQTLLEALEEVPDSSLKDWLEAREPDASIRREVLEMRAAMLAEANLKRPPRGLPPVEIPARIGPYQIERRLGVGGRSIVYLATRDVAGAPQAVALKVLMDHLVEPADLLRFEREQRILASLNHPAIARFLDAGHDQMGRPYLVMEWINGHSVDRYCERVKASPRQKLQLIITALEALQAAHQSLIVHLDLKPSNLLVDRNGQLKVVDFGTAKLLDDLGDSTRTRLMTPRYASPEQLRGDPISTASDIFSLAVTLHELITGQTPDRNRSSLAALAERAAGESVAPATGSDPDLDAVLRKAMEPDPKHRYSSALEFAQDLQACLDRRPVRARRPTFTYQVSRFVARNRGGVSLVATLALALLGFAGYAFYEQSRRLAETRRSQEIAKFLTNMLESSATAQTANPNLTVLEMVERADARIERGLAPPADVAARLQSAFAYVMRESGRDEQALGILDRALRRADSSRQPLAQLLTRQGRGEILMRLGRCADALTSFRQADALLPAARQDTESGAIAAYLLARANANSRCESKPEEALRKLAEAASLQGLEPLTQAAISNVQALELSRLGRNNESLAAIERGLIAARSHPDGAYFQIALLRMRSQVQRRTGDLEAARKSIAEAVALSPGKVNRFEELRLPLLQAGILAELNQWDQARALAAKSLSRAQEAGTAAWMLHADAAEVYAKSGECALAIQTYETVDRMTGDKIPNDWRGNRLFFTAECLAQSDPARSASLASEALKVYGALLPESSPRRRRLLVLSNAK